MWQNQLSVLLLVSGQVVISQGPDLSGSWDQALHQALHGVRLELSFPFPLHPAPHASARSRFPSQNTILQSLKKNL